MKKPAGRKKRRLSPQESRGCLAELGAVYDVYAGELYRYATMILGDPSAAEDAVQQTFAKLAAMGKRINEIASRKVYLRTAVRNECYRILRRHSSDRRTLESTAILEPVEGRKNNEERRRAIEEALRVLPPEQREVVCMKLYERMKFKEIAEALHVSINTAMSRYRYAIQKLRDLLAPYSRNRGHRNGRA